MDIITPEMVVTGVISYYLDGTLPPIGSYENMFKMRPQPPS